MIHNNIATDVKILSTGYTENSILLDDGEQMLPEGYYMELDIDGDEFVIPIDFKTYQAIHNAVMNSTDLNNQIVEIEEAV